MNVFTPRGVARSVLASAGSRQRHCAGYARQPNAELACHPSLDASKKVPVFAGSECKLIGGCIAPLIRPSATFSPQEAGGRRLSITHPRDELLQLAMRTHREPSPLRRGEKVPKADEGSLS